MDMMIKHLDKLALEALCDKYKSGSVLLLDNYNHDVWNDTTPTVTTTTASKHFLMLIYEADSNTAD